MSAAPTGDSLPAGTWIMSDAEITAVLDALVHEANARLDRRVRRLSRYAERGASLLFVQREVDLAQRNVERVERLREHVLRLLRILVVMP
jgi:2-methylisocitrate lyase-like PEP mutase family enzyme